MAILRENSFLEDVNQSINMFLLLGTHLVKLLK